MFNKYEYIKYRDVYTNFDGSQCVDEWETDDKCLVVYLSNEDVTDTENEYKQYINQSGNVYNRSNLKDPDIREFINIYFGEYDDGYIETPSKYVCPDEQSAKKLYQIVKDIRYHDQFNQCGVDVDLIDNYILVRGFDY